MSGEEGEMSQAVAVRQEQSLVQKDQFTPQDLVAQVRVIQEVMRTVMKKDEHYGVIPGTNNKPSLLKPGAEKLCLLFRLAPEYEVMPESSASDNFIRYVVRCNLKHIPTGMFAGSGIGSCNSREAKYRYRTTDTGRGVPKEYWDTRDPALLGGPQFKPRKVSRDGQRPEWLIFEQIEHDNPWDYDNTLVKMAEKRALVAALLNATAASDIFTQDLEDLQANGVLDVTPHAPSTPAAGPANQAEKRADPSPAPAGGGASSPVTAESLAGRPERWWPEALTTTGRYRFDALQVEADAQGLTRDDIHAYIKACGWKNKSGKVVGDATYLNREQGQQLLEEIRGGAVREFAESTQAGATGGADPDDDIPFAPEA